ncbi:uncharacterized protein DSM5745_11176 [Aspergillus mulundensis]|uniref:Uncharacterized protein n=1 Tax=Aspergillus mulundensis TaxID=1810919 RepID=A0A3D8QBD8_9EURO|nr:hypothetical protein DSM5745_11176 [Aspergillus mulundensis]RDW58970.1 hypothetical protein DSM5745_11176 [Aspergillus mulundensis]
MWESLLFQVTLFLTDKAEKQQDGIHRTMSDIVNYAIGGTGLILTAIATGTGLYTVHVKRKEMRDAARYPRSAEEGAADERVLARATGIQGTQMTLKTAQEWSGYLEDTG